MSDERRRAQRFPLALPIELEGTKGITRDVSGLGVYFQSGMQFDSGSEIDFVIIVPDALDVKCRGRIVRVDVLGGGQFGVAATIDRYETNEKGPIDDFDTPHIIIEQLRAHH